MRNRIRRLVEGLPAEHPARREGERQIARLRRAGGEQRRAALDPRDLALKYLAPGVWRLKEAPRPLINVYLAEDVLIDAGRRWDKRRIFAELEGREISMLALTHVHPDHQGCAKMVCEARGVPLACHEDDVDAMEGRRPVAATVQPRRQVLRPDVGRPAAQGRPRAPRG